MSTPSKHSSLVIATMAVALVAAIVTFAVVLTHPKTDKPAHDHATHSHEETDADGDRTTSHASADQANGQTATISYTNDGFSPRSLTVTSGTTVTVTNNSSRELIFSSGPHPAHNEDPEINLNTLKPGESASFIAVTTGTHGFHDHLDDDLTGTLIVTQ